MEKGKATINWYTIFSFSNRMIGVQMIQLKAKTKQNLIIGQSGIISKSTVQAFSTNILSNV